MHVIAHHLLPFIAAFMLAIPTGAADVVSMADGKQVDGKLVAVDGTNVTVHTGAGEQKLPLGDVRGIAFDKSATPAGDLMNAAGQHVLVAEDGSRLAVKDDAVVDGKVTAATVAGPLSAPIEGVTRLLRPRGTEKPIDLEQQRDRMKLVRGDKDALIVAAPGAAPDEWTAVTGILNGLADGKVQFSFEGTDTAMDAATVPLIEFALVKKPVPAKPAGTLVLADGSQIALASLEATPAGLKVTSPALGVVTVDPAKVSAVRFSGGDRMMVLSDLQPVAVRTTPFFDESFPWRKDRSSAGTPLRLSGTSHERGLGLHAKCEVDFEVAGAFKTLTATAGIDDSAPAGSALLRVLGDGKPLMPDALLHAGAPPQAIRVDVTGVKVLTVVADFEPGTFGAGARVDLCDAALSK